MPPKNEWQKKIVKEYTSPGVVHFDIYSLRTLPITTDRLIKTTKLILDAYTHVPFDIEICEKELEILLNAYCQPLSPDSNEPRIVSGKTASMQNWLVLLRGAELKCLHVYVLCSFFTFCYFLKKHRGNNDLLQDAYQRIKSGNAISLKQIKEVVELILPKDKSKVVNLERLRSVFRKGSIAQMRELFNSQEYLLSDVSEEQESCMKFYFECLETNCKVVAPRKEFRVFYNRKSEPLFIHCKKLMTEAEIDKFEDKSYAYSKKASGTKNKMEKKVINDEENSGDVNDDGGCEDVGCTEKLAEVNMNKDSSSQEYENVAVPADDIEKDEAGLNLIEEPIPEFSDFTSYEIDSSVEETKVERRCLQKRQATLTKSTSVEMSNDESRKIFPEKKKRCLIKNQTTLTMTSLTETMESQRVGESNLKIDAHTEIPYNSMDVQLTAENYSKESETLANVASLPIKPLEETSHPKTAIVAASTQVPLFKPVEQEMTVYSELSTMKVDRQNLMVESSKHLSQSSTNVISSMQILSSNPLQQQTESPATTSVQKVIADFSSSVYDEMSQKLNQYELPTTAAETQKLSTEDVKHPNSSASRNRVGMAQVQTMKRVSPTVSLEKLSPTIQKPFNTKTFKFKNRSQKPKLAKYKKLDIVLVRFTDGGLWPSIIIMKMKQGKKYKIASLDEKIIYNVKADYIQDLIPEDFEYAVENIEDEKKKNQLRAAMIVANRLSITDEIEKQGYINEVLKEYQPK